MFQNSTLDFCIESFLTENGSTIVPIFDPEFGKFKTKLECLKIPVSRLSNLKSKPYLVSHTGTYLKPGLNPMASKKIALKMRLINWES
jgi:hypothetical protein